MINEKGERVAAPPAPAIPPHMLAGMTSPAQKKALRQLERAEAKESAPAAKRAKRSRAKRSAKKAAK